MKFVVFTFKNGEKEDFFITEIVSKLIVSMSERSNLVFEVFLHGFKGLSKMEDYQIRDCIAKYLLREDGKLKIYLLNSDNIERIGDSGVIDIEFREEEGR